MKLHFSRKQFISLWVSVRFFLARACSSYVAVDSSCLKNYLLIKSNEFIGLSHGSIDSIHNDGCICKIIGFIRCCCWFGSSPPIVLVF